MAGNDLFNPDVSDQNDTASTEIPEDALAGLVGEGKKFKSNEDLARSKYEADQFIDRLQKENAQTREELKQRVSMGEFLTKLEQQNTQGTQSTPGPDERVEEDTASLSPDQVSELVETKLSSHQQKLTQEQNIKSVREQLVKTMGPDYTTKLAQKVRDLGLDENFADGLAATHPTAFLKLVLDKPVESSYTAPPESTQARGDLSSHTGSTRKWADYEKMRKDNVVLYSSPTVQNQMHKDAMTQGEDFYT